MPSEDDFDFSRAEGLVENHAEIVQAASQVALYMGTLKDTRTDLSEYERVELTKEFMATCFGTDDE